MDVLVRRDRHEQPVRIAGGRLPDFLIVGAMKSGTTTLYEHLRRDDRIFMATPKEPMFFSRDNVFARGEAWYRGLFNGARHDQLCGESSTCYSRHLEYPNAANRIAQHLPNAKFIYLMRHPVERAYAVYKYIVEGLWPQPPPTFDQAAAQYHSPILDSGMYIREIEHLLNRLSRERFLFLILDDLHRDPAAVLRTVEEFLGLAPGMHDHAPAIKENQSGSIIARGEVARRLHWVRRLPVVSTLVDLVPRSLRRASYQFLADRLTKRELSRRAPAVLHEATPLSADLRRNLLQEFEPSVVELEEFLDRKLPAWHR